MATVPKNYVPEEQPEDAPGIPPAYWDSRPSPLAGEEVPADG